MKSADIVLAVGAALLAHSAPAAEPGPLGLQAKLDRPAPIYAINDSLSITVSAARPVTVEIVLIDGQGVRTPIVPSATRGLLHLQAGQSARVPERGALTVTPPPGRYEIKVSARLDTVVARSIAHADSRLADRDLREDQSLFFIAEDAHGH